MKNIKLLLIGLAAAFALTGCGDSSKDTPEPEGDGNVVGSWHLVSWSSLQSADVYLSFSESGSFDIYQRLYKPEYVHLDGTYSYDKPTLSGRYSDNTPWGSASYRVSFNADGTRMTLTSTSSTSDVSVFVKAEIPSEIISGALESTPQSRAEDMPRFLRTAVLPACAATLHRVAAFCFRAKAAPRTGLFRTPACNLPEQ